MFLSRGFIFIFSRFSFEDTLEWRDPVISLKDHTYIYVYVYVYVLLGSDYMSLAMDDKMTDA